LVPLPEFAAEFASAHAQMDGNLLDKLVHAVRERSQIAVQRNDFKWEQVPPHLFMNFRVVDEHGRQLGMGRQLAALKVELGGQARSAFQALAMLKRSAPVPDAGAPVSALGRAESTQVVRREGERPPVASASSPKAASPMSADSARAEPAPVRHTAWTFGELPELMEIRKAGQTLIGFPALIDCVDHVLVEVFDEPSLAAQQHRAGLRRLVALQLKEPLKYLEKNIPGLTQMAVAYMPLGSADELRAQIVEVALDRAFLQDPLPQDSFAFAKRIEEGRTRLNLIAQEVARLVASVLVDYAAAARKLKDSKPPKDVADDIVAQLQRLLPKRFVSLTPYSQMQHLSRYLKGVVMRLDKLRADPARDAQRLAELRPLEQAWLRRVADRRGQADVRLDDFRWQLEELRISLFAQELRTPQPVSVKRLDKVWAQLSV
jgi:ATP-dependent helicase HrpA